MINGTSFDLSLRVRIVEKASSLKETMDDALALKIINRLADSLNKGK